MRRCSCWGRHISLSSPRYISPQRNISCNRILLQSPANAGHNVAGHMDKPPGEQRSHHRRFSATVVQPSACKCGESGLGVQAVSRWVRPHTPISPDDPPAEAETRSYERRSHPSLPSRPAYPAGTAEAVSRGLLEPRPGSIKRDAAV